ncbi:hypothetical protein [Streptomyces shenzhenensis]|uniref:hypothetical protein n=1 Tax=Streptomyces shenzhenensis TaxID=943815 RepID=UPI00369F6BD9
MSETIRRRSLPDSLRWLADKLDSGALTQAEQAGVAAILHLLADEINAPQPACNCGAPQGDDEDDADIRRRWQHSRSCPQG